LPAFSYPAQPVRESLIFPQKESWSGTGGFSAGVEAVLRGFPLIFVVHSVGERDGRLAPILVFPPDAENPPN